MVNFVYCPQILGQNGIFYFYYNYVTGLVCGVGDPNTVTKQLQTSNVTIVNSFWLIPRVQNGRVIGYAVEAAINTSVPPTIDSCKALLVKDKQDVTSYYIAIANTDNIATSSPPNQFAYDADGLGGSLPVMPTVTLPFPVIQNPPTSVSGSNNIFTFNLPNNPLGLLYSIPAAFFNGALSATPYAPSGITTPAGFVTWANAHWSAYGTWSNPTGTIIQLTSATTNVSFAGFIAALTPAPWCFSLAGFGTPSQVNQVKFGSTGTVLSVPAFMLGTNPATLQAVLQTVMTQESTSYVMPGGAYLTVNTVLAQPILLYNGATVATASSGVCP
jgi:hypothetical protein